MGQVGKQLGGEVRKIGSAFVNGVQKNIFHKEATQKLKHKKDEIMESKIERVFLEPTGRHVMICSD